MKEVIIECLPAILEIVILVVLGLVSKKVSTYANTGIKKSIITDTVKYIEQIYTDIHGGEKLNAAKEKAIELLNEKGIKITDNELTVLIESAVKVMNNESTKKIIEEIKNGGGE